MGFFDEEMLYCHETNKVYNAAIYNGRYCCACGSRWCTPVEITRSYQAENKWYIKSEADIIIKAFDRRFPGYIKNHLYDTYVRLDGSDAFIDFTEDADVAEIERLIDDLKECGLEPFSMKKVYHNGKAVFCMDLVASICAEEF